MPIAKGIDIEDINVGGHHEIILTHRSEEMPRIEVQEGSDNIRTVSRGERNDDDASDRTDEFPDFV